VAGTVGEKLYYRIGEIAEALSVRTSVIRFWETQFESLQPQKTRSGQRLYSRQDLARIQEIKRLLYNEKLTIAGARERLASRQKQEAPQTDQAKELLLMVRQELRKLRDSM
jgi:DNA-binding transcriptional MerR regulator